jgi:hypothetical protein
LILLFILGILFSVGLIWSGSSKGPPMTDAPSAVPLPHINLTTPVAALLPTAPEASKAPVYVGDDLACVPELMLEAAPDLTRDEWRSRKAHAAAAALHLNSKEQEGYLKALLSSRPDLAGLPFTMGDSCRTRGARAKAFKEAAEAVRSQKATALVATAPAPDAGEETRQQLYQAHLAVVTQVIFAEDAPGQNALVRAVSSIPRPEATRALARLAVFSTDEAVRAAAVEALAVRGDEDSTEVLVAALSYPWPAVAEQAASAIAKLKRKDLIPQLKAMLDAPDPRGPTTEVVAGQAETVAREVVRVNHLRNCLLCHAPAERGKTPAETLVGEVPVPTMPVPDTSAGYGRSESNLLVRIDVTYLRHDFSAMQVVTDWSAESWSPTQRFDFLVRRRVLTPAEAAELRTRLAAVSPYRRAAARALRELTGRDFKVKADEGHQLLPLSAPLHSLRSACAREGRMDSGGSQSQRALAAARASMLAS